MKKEDIKVSSLGASTDGGITTEIGNVGERVRKTCFLNDRHALFLP